MKNYKRPPSCKVKNRFQLDFLMDRLACNVIISIFTSVTYYLGKAHILEVLNALYHELAACEILSTGAPQEQTSQSLNALVISC